MLSVVVVNQYLGMWGHNAVQNIPRRGDEILAEIGLNGSQGEELKTAGAVA